MEKIMKTIADNHVFPNNYSRELLVIDKGKGVYVSDLSGKEYLDFGSGISVNSLGYGREDLADAAYQQMIKLVHTSNLYATEPVLKLGEKLVKSGPFSAVHFGNSGTEANEAAIKYARLYSLRTKGDGNHKILSFTNGFHGRTLGALSATPKQKYQEPFKPLVPGMEVCKYNDPAELEKTLNSSFAAVFVEIVQGEGGLDSISSDFADALNMLCKKNNVLLIVDEVQTGLTRTGSLYAYEQAGLKPDIVTLAKPIAGGIPLSATLIPDKVNSLVRLGEHGTTFGGNPVAAAVGLKVWDELSSPDFIKQVAEKGKYLTSLLNELSGALPSLGKVKGLGLLQGIELKHIPPGDAVKKLQESGLLILSSGINMLRIAPPLVISEEELKKGTDILKSVLSKM
jgi:acetylornithine/N-succinyldiaminopimelate aminotransferase